MPSKTERMIEKNEYLREELSVLSRQPDTDQSRVSVRAVRGRLTEIRIRAIIPSVGQAGKGQ